MKKQILLVGPDLKPLAVPDRDQAADAESWEFFTATDGRQALSALAARTFDAAVVDLTLPEPDGAQVLTELQRRHPQTLRFAYTPVTEDPAQMKRWAADHHLLVKPSNGQILRELLERTFAFVLWLPGTTAHALISNLQTIPSPPPLYLELVRELESPRSSVKTIGQLIAQDPALTAKILQLANSAAFGLHHRVADAGSAVLYLGADIVKGLVLLAHTFTFYERFNPAEFSLPALWEHSVATAKCARSIAREENLEDEAAAELYTAGLLHDLGKLVLVANLPGPCAQARKRALNAGVPLWQAERDVLGATHAEIAAALLGLWRLPDDIVEAVAWHHEPSASSELAFSPVTAVHAANVLAHEIRQDWTPLAPAELDSRYLTHIGASARLAEWRAACARS